MASLNEIKKVLKAQGACDYAFCDTDLEGRAAFHVRFDDLPADTAAFRAALAPFQSQIEVSDKGLLFLAAQ